MNACCKVLAAMSCALLCGISADVLAKPLVRTEVVQTEDGPVRGFVTDGVRVYLGIPYAAPPVGDLRWRPPEPPAPWHQPLEAVAFGNRCPQTNTLGSFAAPSTTEDCLYLNVFTPGNAANSEDEDHLRPVMFWIHGGGLLDGESNDYDGRKLAKNGGVVVVTINYRLNVFGFLAHPALDSEGHAFANYGLMDQQFGLQWVKSNIAAFGGDPANVTIFGESAGGQSVLANLASPTATGLFQQGIVESGAYAVEFNASGLSAAEASGQSFATTVGCTDQTAACLRSVSVHDIQTLGAAYSGSANLTVDGTVLTQTIRAAIQSGHFNRVPVMNGTNHDEMTWFVGLTELATGHVMTAADYPNTVAATYGATNAPLVLAQYPLADYSSPSLAFAAAETSSIMACPAYAIDQWLSRYVPTYAYEFADETAPSSSPLVSFPYGAAHTFEIQYLFPLYHGASGTINRLNAAQRKLSDQMVSYWTAFARSGDPNSGRASFWPQFGTGPADFQSLASPQPVPTSTFVSDHHCAFWNSLLGLQ
jgi:para-nitrobenzyl esterase